MMTRTFIAGRVSLTIGLLATIVAISIGVLYGATSGYLGGRVDQMMMRVVDILYSLPFIFFVIMLVVFFGRNFILMFIAVGAVEWLDMARIVRETLAYVMREMTHPEGGFYSTQDADSEGEEGRFFVWDREEVIRLLGEEDGTLFCRVFDVQEGGNFEQGKSILNIPVTANARPKARPIKVSTGLVPKYSSSQRPSKEHPVIESATYQPTPTSRIIRVNIGDRALKWSDKSHQATPRSQKLCAKPPEDPQFELRTLSQSIFVNNEFVDDIQSVGSAFTILGSD